MWRQDWFSNHLPLHLFTFSFISSCFILSLSLSLPPFLVIFFLYYILDHSCFSGEFFSPFCVCVLCLCPFCHISTTTILKKKKKIKKNKQTKNPNIPQKQNGIFSAAFFFFFFFFFSSLASPFEEKL